MTKEKMSKGTEEPDPITQLLRQMGLGEDEIDKALDLAQSIEEKIEQKSQDETELVTSKLERLSKKELIELVKDQDSQLKYFQNVVAIQFILLIKKYKDNIKDLENKLLQKNAQIQILSQELEKLHE